MRKWFAGFLSVCMLGVFLGAEVPSIERKTAGMEKAPGFFSTYWDGRTGKIWLEIDKLDIEFLYVNSLPAGLGSNDIGLDRNQLGGTRIIRFTRIGPKVLMMQPNYAFRALSEDPDERKAVEDAFAKSVIWGFQVEAESSGRILVDATPFLLRDAHDVIGRIRRSGQGDFQLDPSRSAIYRDNTKNFPENTEFESLLTFTCGNPGHFVREVAPDPTSVTVRQHHSFIRLPDEGYQPRVFDPRSMYGGRSGYMDFAAPIDQPLRKRFISRHRLHKKDPSAKVSDPVDPIIYYVDRSAPEPIRSALVEGAQWWNQAFEAIGYRDAFQVKVLPRGADPMDIRYNMINWVHRSQRGWSYGASVTDPRTGEIIKGHVALGSQRVRQDYLIALGLVGEYTGDPDDSAVMKKMALARIRQLSCHEVGHTLGVGHNYASSVNNRASVMDYPHPRVKIRSDGSLDLSDAYAVGIGEWDKVCVAYGYQHFPEGVDEKKALSAILDRAFSDGLLYLTNQDAAPAGGAHPLSNDWDNGTDPIDELEHKLKIRRIALNRFSESKVRRGESLAALEEVLVPVYLFHRYQIEAAASVLGGLMYNHTVRDGAQKAPEMVSASEQRRALQALLGTIQAENLEIPQKILDLIPPRAPGIGQTRELFPGYTGIVFDPLAAAETLAGITVGSLLHPERAARLVQHHARFSELPGLGEVIDELLESTWKSNPGSGYRAELHRTADCVALFKLMELAVSDKAAPQVQAVARLKLRQLRDWLDQRISAAEEDQKAHFLFGSQEIDLFQRDPKRIRHTAPLSPPPGAPIGMP